MNKNESKYYNTSLLMDEALLILLETKDYEYISVREITKKAGVSRSTFYLHYDSIDDLLNEAITRINDKFYKYFDSEVNVKEEISNKKVDNLLFITPKYLKPYLNFVFENKKLFKLCINKSILFNSNKKFNEFYKTYFLPTMDYFNINKEKQPYIVAYHIHGILSIISKWLDNDCKESIDQIVDTIIYCLNLSIKK